VTIIDLPNQERRQIFGAVFVVNSVGFDSTSVQIGKNRVPVTIIGSWRRKYEKIRGDRDRCLLGGELMGLTIKRF